MPPPVFRFAPSPNGYLHLGQSATTLSGGEAQRVKIASELYRQAVERTVYLLDEPTIGLHYADVKKLIEILDRLVAKGNTVMVIEPEPMRLPFHEYTEPAPEAGVETELTRLGSIALNGDQEFNTERSLSTSKTASIGALMSSETWRL